MVIPNNNKFFIVELPTVGNRTYVDPTNYDRPEEAISDFATEIDPSILYLEMLIGGGEHKMLLFQFCDILCWFVFLCDLVPYLSGQAKNVM